MYTVECVSSTNSPFIWKFSLEAKAYSINTGNSKLSYGVRHTNLYYSMLHTLLSNNTLTIHSAHSLHTPWMQTAEDST